MMRLGIGLSAGLLLVLGLAPGVQAAGTNESSDFSEVYNLLRDHLTGVSQAELNRAAVTGLVSALSPKVSLISGTASNGTAKGAPLVTTTRTFDDDIGYVRIRGVEDGLAKVVQGAFQRLSATNKLKGLVLDLRFTGGQDYAAAAASADLFIHKDQPLLDWGEGMVRAKEKEDSISLPVAVLVNRQTAGAAEALAAVLRETGTGLVLGSKTAGQAAVAEEFPLKNGQRLRIATAPVRLGDGSVLAAQGVKPDIQVDVSGRDERSYYDDAFKEISPVGLASTASTLSATNDSNRTNRTARRTRFNEAVLERERKEGTLEAEELSGSEPEAEPVLVRDPALARALDVLKGLALVRQSRY